MVYLKLSLGMNVFNYFSDMYFPLLIHYAKRIFHDCRIRKYQIFEHVTYLPLDKMERIKGKHIF